MPLGKLSEKSLKYTELAENVEQRGWKVAVYWGWSLSRLVCVQVNSKTDERSGDPRPGSATGYKISLKGGRGGQSLAMI